MKMLTKNLQVLKDILNLTYLSTSELYSHCSLALQYIAFNEVIFETPVSCSVQ